MDVKQNYIYIGDMANAHIVLKFPDQCVIRSWKISLLTPSKLAAVYLSLK